jgi:serine protease AprX
VLSCRSMITRIVKLTLPLIFLWLVFGGMSPGPSPEIDPRVWEDLEKGGAGHFLIVFRSQKYFDGFSSLGRDSQKRIASAVSSLQAAAVESQTAVRDHLSALGADFRSYWIANVIAVQGGQALVEELLRFPEIERIESDCAFKVALEEPEQEPRAPSMPEAIEWNITKINAPELWGRGVSGQGIVVASADTGVQWDHPALKNAYRGWDGAGANHNYNWHDAIHGQIAPSLNNCGGYNLTSPCDDHGHGTHTTGTMVGDDGGGNQIGVAPQAKWIACRNMDAGVGRPSTYIECLQFFTAPTDLSGQNANPALHADVIDNSYACTSGEGCNSASLQAAVNNVRNAGIFMAVSAGNEGSGCSTISDPPGIYAEVFSVASVDSSNLIADTSSRGPVTIDGSNRRKPDISAPGVGVRSSIRGSSYAPMSGTSMAAPHVAGVAVLLWSAFPSLRTDVAVTEQFLKDSAVPRYSSQGCGTDGADTLPNNVYGSGVVDALAAYNLAQQYSPTATPTAIATVTAAASATPTVQATATIEAEESPTAAPTAAGDLSAPVVKALPGSGKAGSRVKLRYQVRDDSGYTADVLSVLKGKKVAMTNSQPLRAIPAKGTRQVAVKTKRLKAGAYKFCVVAGDQAGNQSRRSCAKLTLS